MALETYSVRQRQQPLVNFKKFVVASPMMLREWDENWGSRGHQGVSEFVYFFAENTRITPKITKFNKLNLAHTRLYIICIVCN